MENINYEILGTKISKERVKRYMTQEQLGAECDISASFLGHIERGTRKMSLETLASICIALDTNPGYLLFNNDTIVVEDNGDIIIHLDSLSTRDIKKKQSFINAVNALTEGIDKL